MNKWGAPRNESSTPRREGLACGVMCSFCAGPEDEGHWRVQGFTAGRLIRMQCAYVTETEARQELKGRRPPNDDDRFRCSDGRRPRHKLGYRGRSIAAVPAGTGVDGRGHPGIRLVDHACGPPPVVIGSGNQGAGWGDAV